MPVAHLKKSTKPYWGGLQGLRLKYYMGSAITRPKGGSLPVRVHRSILIRCRLVLVVFLTSISVPVRAASPAQLPEGGLSHTHWSGGEDGDLICCGRRDKAHTQEGKLGLRGSQEPIPTRSSSAMSYLLSEKANAVLHSGCNHVGEMPQVRQQHSFSSLRLP